MSSFPSHLFRHVKFRTKILCVTGIVTLLPIAFLFGFFYRQIASLQEREITNSTLAFEQNAYSINQAMDGVVSNALQACSNPEISGFFSKQTNSKQYILGYVTSLRPYMSFYQEAASPHVAAFRFYTQNQHLFSNLAVHNVYKSQDTAFFDEISEALEGNRLVVLLSQKGRTYYSIEYSSQGSLSIFCPVASLASSRTVLECELSLSSVYQDLKFSTNDFESTGYTLLHQSGQVLFSSDPQWAAQAAHAILPQVIEKGQVRNMQLSFDGKNLLVNAAPLSSIDCVLISHSDLGAVFKPVRDFQLPVLLMILLCVLVCCLLATALVNSLLRRSRTINNAILQIQEGDFDVCLPVEGSDFIDQVAENLNGMAAQIKNLIHNNYESQLEIKDLQIRMLSQQISPHFLYNTLECLRMRAVLEDNLETAQALLSLGRLLRYYANYAGEFATVSAELEVARDYLNIVSMMEEQDCVLEQDIPQALLSRSMPRFMLQPIIENSVKHGGNAQGAAVQIHLSLQEEGGLLRFTVRDNGAGVPPERALEIQQRLLAGADGAAPETSIGLFNTNARIKLLYGEEYGILFSSIEGVGASITLTIPSGQSEEQP